MVEGVYEAVIHLDREFAIGEIDDRLRGSFVEHLGRCVYGGIFEPGHHVADAAGFRRDVLDLVAELAPPVVRYPGGNFVSSYRWEDGVGPPGSRPARLELNWHSVESNRFGLGEFIAWCAAASSEPMLALNLGTRGIESALALLEYANFPGGTAYSELRRAHGSPEPFNVKLWCLGNELDGPWQIGHKPAEDYGRLAAEVARAMRRMDPGLELVACGSSHRRMPSFGAWEATVLDHCYDEVDYLSLHSYYRPDPDDVPTFLASAEDMDSMIDAVVATCDAVRARKRSAKVMYLAFDEWNVWYPAEPWTARQERWREAPPLFEDAYDIADAVVVGSLLNTLVRHADRVRIACFAQLVNVIAPIKTRSRGPSWRETTFFPLRDAARHVRGRSLEVRCEAPRIETGYGEVPLLDVAACLDDDHGRLALLVANRSLSDAAHLTGALRGLGGMVPVAHEWLASDGPYRPGEACNTEADPERVRPRRAALSGDALDVVLPPLSWNVVLLEERR